MASLTQNFKNCFLVLSTPGKICRRAHARDREGRRVRWDSKDAVSWCSIGIIAHHFKEDAVGGSEVRRALVKTVRPHVPDETSNVLSWFHDNKTDEEVIEAWRKTGLDNWWFSGRDPTPPGRPSRLTDIDLGPPGAA